jgi:hypothetical protein
MKLPVVLTCCIFWTLQCRAESFQGIVSTTLGDPLPGVEIVAYQIDAFRLVRAGSSVSDARGRYEIADVPVGEYLICASMTGFLTGEYWRVRPDHDLNIRLGVLQSADPDFPSTVSGVLRLPAGRPATDCTVQLMAVGYRHRIMEAWTGSDGAFEFIADSAGDHVLTVFCPGYRAIAEVISISGGEQTLQLSWEEDQAK